MQLEKGTDETKVETMKRILTIMLNGDPMPSLLMHIIRFVMPSKYKPLKKLLYFYYEICPKLDSSGKLKQEMILVCTILPRTPTCLCPKKRRFCHRLYFLALALPDSRCLRTYFDFSRGRE
ncbi:hypothetical protein LB505_004370 [Fusarium chuoi]|nr:hypothetical protein LB505_004370 [Fusarium chuoi]